MSSPGEKSMKPRRALNAFPADFKAEMVELMLEEGKANLQERRGPLMRAWRWR
ncbi:hypothetical protein [Myxococcus sp. SDU36]|uniref:hypothetical protein n=1 Tax=Myxococcus sp. SDU36 TaxID=2831967 RepID=UPI00254396B9|nr:hypothetical protein [Myxococcus sp. SDU36]WIG96025.1 hypothetical protein KGD87_00725 [Myxococcus sp. SDU36]